MSKSKTCKECGKKKCDTKIGPYNKIKCEEGSQAHHIVPDYTLRKGLRPTNIAESKAGRISDELPNLNQGMSICLEGGSKDEGSEHHKAHNCDDIILKKSHTGNPPGTVSLGQVLKASRESAIAAKPECKKEITKALREQYKGVDRKQRLRGVQNANDLSTDATNALGTSPSNTNIGF